MKFLFLIYYFSFSVSCRNNSKNFKRTNAQKVLNALDSLTETLGPPASSLVAYFQQISKMANEDNDYKLQKEQIDSLTQYFDALKLVYDQATLYVTENKTIGKFQILKNNFIELLKLGKEPWIKVIPVQLKMFKNGQTSLSISEQNTVTSTGTIFKTSAEKNLKRAKMLTTQEDDLKKK